MLCESVHQLDCKCLSCAEERDMLCNNNDIYTSQHTQSCANLTLLDMSKCSCDNTDEWEDLPF